MAELDDVARLVAELGPPLLLQVSEGMLVNNQVLVSALPGCRRVLYANAAMVDLIRTQPFYSPDWERTLPAGPGAEYQPERFPLPWENGVAGADLLRDA